MKTLRILALACAGLGFTLLSSCGCCTGESPAKPLGPAPVFKDLNVVEYSGK